MSRDPLLFKQGHLSFATGGAKYADADDRCPVSEARVVIRVAPALVSPSPKSIFAVMDTAAPWCIFEPEVAGVFERTLEPLRRAVLSTRLGTFQGTLYRGLITLSADQGESLDVQATVFLSPDWPGPNFIGYEGLLQRIRFAVDPEENLFYFGPL